MESINLSAVFELPMVFVLEDNGLAIHTKKNVRTSLKNYCDIANSFNIRTFSTSFKNPEDMFYKFKEAYKYSRDRRLPSFITVECYRWLEHVGISSDWELGYRAIEELEEWKKCDIIESPNIISLTPDFVNKKSLFYKNKFTKMFEECMNYPDPEPNELLRNVY